MTYRNESKRAERLRAIRVYNNHDLLVRFGATAHCIEYYTGEFQHTGRHTTVYSPGAMGAQFTGKRAISWPQALMWAQEKTGHTFVASPFGGAIPEHVLQRAEAEAKAAAALNKKASKCNS